MDVRNRNSKKIKKNKEILRAFLGGYAGTNFVP